MVKAYLTKPLDGHAEGAVRDFDKHDFERLKGMGAVRALTEDEESAEAAKEAAEGEKAAPAVENKDAPPVANKAEGGAPAADITRAERTGGRKQGS